ncbi:CPBP family intramembrane glutamic endopeptidase [Halanaerobacter jeridensis]|uniref:Membrane protease YdiL (CAAX protease family) n=1 Tax=Halanaerobacter jeridensis TaxID=706427 RepID=A0A938XP30_9FIRM|nr:type II CAAX endopeptidase family protein [Halanaerobacter jeridensis]MBM7556152.1 membrane protease YdiL (CAAX protease family) [Halanaerobacter jeridensis]
MDKKSFLLVIAIVVNLLWYFVFNSSLFNFWLRLVVAIVVLNVIAFSYQSYNFSFELSDITWGFISAVVLYLIFVLGRELSEVLFAGSRAQIMSVYVLKAESNLLVISGVLLVVGAGEELFWRGFWQQNLVHEFGPVVGFILASLSYGLVHLWTGNFILVLAALTAGLFWGYLFLKTKSITMVVISHIVWDILIFVVVPLNF